jgi:hypothetical protein
MVQALRYSISGIRSEVRYLLEADKLHRGQPVKALSQCFPACDWPGICEELEICGIQPQDPLADLLGPEEWPND